MTGGTGPKETPQKAQPQHVHAHCFFFVGSGESALSKKVVVVVVVVVVEGEEEEEEAGGGRPAFVRFCLNLSRTSTSHVVARWRHGEIKPKRRSFSRYNRNTMKTSERVDEASREKKRPPRPISRANERASASNAGGLRCCGTFRRRPCVVLEHENKVARLTTRAVCYLAEVLLRCCNM